MTSNDKAFEMSFSKKRSILYTKRPYKPSLQIVHIIHTIFRFLSFITVEIGKSESRRAKK